MARVSALRMRWVKSEHARHDAEATASASGPAGPHQHQIQLCASIHVWAMEGRAGQGRGWGARLVLHAVCLDRSLQPHADLSCMPPCQLHGTAWRAQEARSINFQSIMSVDSHWCCSSCLQVSEVKLPTGRPPEALFCQTSHCPVHRADPPGTKASIE